jgi:hypothetical protein
MVILQLKIPIYMFPSVPGHALSSMLKYPCLQVSTDMCIQASAQKHKQTPCHTKPFINFGKTTTLFLVMVGGAGGLGRERTCQYPQDIWPPKKNIHKIFGRQKKSFPFLKTLEKKTCSQMFLFYIAYFSKQNRDQMKEGNKKK